MQKKKSQQYKANMKFGNVWMIEQLRKTFKKNIASKNDTLI